MIQSYILISGWRQINGDLAQWPGQTAREQGGSDAVARLAHRGVGQADDGEARKTVGDVNLDRDRSADGAVERGGGDGREHAEERSRRPSARAPAICLRSFDRRKPGRLSEPANER